MSLEHHEPPDPDEGHASPIKPKIIGIYGISGCGKTFLLKQLKAQFGNKGFEFYEGSTVLNNIVPGGTIAFEQLTESEKSHWRQEAIKTIRRLHSPDGTIAVVTGHYMFWPELEGYPKVACTKADLDTYTHILYLDTPAELTRQRRLDDDERDRDQVSVLHLNQWQEREKSELRSVCYQNQILFSLIPSDTHTLTRVKSILIDIQNHDDEAVNKQRVLDEVYRSFGARMDKIKTFVVMDGDRTLTKDDTGKAFWNLVYDKSKSTDSSDPLKSIFSSPLGYTYQAFEQAALLYEEGSFNGQKFDDLCKQVASKTALYPQFLSFLHTMKDQNHIGLVIVTCGLRKIWEAIIQKYGLSMHVYVMGGGTYPSDRVITGEVKASIVEHLKATRGKKVLAFGDSILDLQMLQKADRGIVVVGDEQSRSKTMDKGLAEAIEQGEFHGHQVLLPSTVSPRLNTEQLPTIDLTDHEFISAIFGKQYHAPALQVVHATNKNATKVLMTSMRDAQNSGPNLRKSHRKVGQHLTTEYLTDIVGLEEYPIHHVQGHFVSGYRLLHENQTLIVALMRGGEPMALGVNEVIPTASFLHAKIPTDIRSEHVESTVTVVLVDSVINTGKSIVEFVEHISKLHATVRIVIVTGVAQAASVDVITELQSSVKYNKLSLIALRVSDNKFTGKGTTDTGNRLFNTTALL